jgi:hypothetical protein
VSLLKGKYKKILDKTYFIENSNKSGEPGSSGSIVSVYRLDDRAIQFRSSAEAKGFFL